MMHNFKPKDIVSYFWLVKTLAEFRIKEINQGKPRNTGVVETRHKRKKNEVFGKIEWNYDNCIHFQLIQRLRNLKDFTIRFHKDASIEQKRCMAKIVTFVDDVMDPWDSPNGTDNLVNLTQLLGLIREFEIGLPEGEPSVGKSTTRNKGGRPRKTPGKERIPELEKKSHDWFSWPAQRMASELGCAVSTLKQSPLWAEAIRRRDHSISYLAKTRRRGRNG